MAKKAQSRTVQYLIYLAVRLVICLLQALPVTWALGLGRWLGWVGYKVDRRHRLVAAENLRFAFPEMSEAQIDAMVRKVYRHFFCMAVETIILMRKCRPSTAAKYLHHVSRADYDRVDQWILSDKPVLVLTGHLGNWEAWGFMMAAAKRAAHVVYRPLDNLYLDRFVRAFRTAHRMSVVEKDGATAEIQSVMAQGGKLALVGDQDAGPRGLFVDFFGRPASTYKSIALLSLEYQAPILVVSAVRQGPPLCQLLMLEDEIRPEDYANHPDAVRAITERYTKALERMVRRYPEQYLWLHRRWKHQPKPRAKKVA